MMVMDTSRGRRRENTDQKGGNEKSFPQKKAKREIIIYFLALFVVIS